MRDTADVFFEELVTEEMERISFQNALIQLYLAGLLRSSLRMDTAGIFHVRKDPALALCVFGAEHRELAKIGDKLLLGVGIFPEHFIARGKREVSLGYYLGMLEKVVAKRLSQKVPVWAEIHGNFGRTVTSLHGVRKRMKFNNSDLRAIMDVYEATGEFLI